MATSVDTHPSMLLAPLERGERIAALDVVRGFALIGILLMNIEFFNRPTSDIGSGIPTGLSGANLVFSLFVQYFVIGKFWTMFSLLFGMGFGVMLTRAETAGRNFLVPYLRRITALAVFGALHGILVWSGDILFSYSVAALCLLVVLFGRGKFIVLAIALLGAAGLLLKLTWTYQIAGCLAYFGWMAWYLRCPQHIDVSKRSVPVFKIVTRLNMMAAAAAIAAGFLIPGLPREAKVMMPIVGSMVLLLNLLMIRYHAPAAARPWRIGVAMYVFSCLMLIGFGAGQYYFPEPVAAGAPSPAAALRSAERAKAITEHKAEMAGEVAVLTKGSYADAVAMRSTRFIAHAPGQFGFSTIIVCMFLLGLWFVRSGVIANAGAHLPLFRKLALFGLPLGIGLGLLGATIAVRAVPGTLDGHILATGLLRLGNLPACLGYVGLVVVMLHSRSPFARIAVLAPFGRMALTNYLTHSVLFTLVFYGYGLGYYGIERKWQLACVVAMLALQIPFSHWWLSRWRYGPMEWLWRAITYWQLPAMRIASAANLPLRPA
ncbi:DUF418 domain-containing protein [Massilia sp. TWP1-3-3]|uniref:DUF418 domain-containing protein n=1 Tax=Massilia sp. TWP1-3-3 TaxID=2804573 RepID=UPI003CEA07C4